MRPCLIPGGWFLEDARSLGVAAMKARVAPRRHACKAALGPAVLAKPIPGAHRYGSLLMDATESSSTWPLLPCSRALSTACMQLV